MARESAAKEPLATDGVDVDEPRDTPPAWIPRRGLAVVLRASLLVSGSGVFETDAQCAGDLCDDSVISASSDYDDASSFSFEGDVLYHMNERLRVGAGLLVVPSSTVDLAGAGGKIDMGTELAPLAIVEGVFGERFAGTVRAFGGLQVLFAGGDYEESLKAIDSTCQGAAGGGIDCAVTEGPFLGAVFGLGGGILGQVSESVALRGDLTLQYQSLTLSTLEVRSADGSIDTEDSDSSVRYWLTAGVEF